MMKLAFENTISRSRIVELAKQADDKIHVRGYHPRYNVPAHLRNTEWLLPFSEIPIKYCPTDRYSYLNKYERSIKRKQSWEALRGLILDNFYSGFIGELCKYLDTARLGSVNIINGLQEFNDEFLSYSKSIIAEKRVELLNPPKNSDIKELEQLIERTSRYEIELASALLDYKISVTDSPNIKSISTILFPFVVKPSYTVGSFGISSTAQPDFLFDNKIIIDVKSPPWNDDFLCTLGGYALVHEKMTGKSMDLGMIITPEYRRGRNVPLLFKSEIILIEDVYRKRFLLRRDKLLEMMEQFDDPRTPSTDSECKSCGYYNYCWPNP